MTERILPFYVVCDESYSMADHLVALNEGLRELHGAVHTEPAITGRTHLCLIGFSATARILEPLSPPEQGMRGVGTLGMSASAETNFATVFKMLRTTIQHDVEVLQADSREVCQPVVFFLSDGQPTDPAIWPAAYAGLVDRDWAARPRIVAFGIGDADTATIARIGTYKAYMSNSGVTPGRALREFAVALTSSVVSTRSDDGDLHVPKQVTGFTALETDLV